MAVLAGLGLIAALAVESPVLDTERLNEPAQPVEEAVEESIEEELIEEALEETVEDAEGAVVRPYAPLRSPTSCPEDIETLTALLIRDIPTYSNRVLQRSAAVLPNSENPNDTEVGNLLIKAPYRPAFIIIAGRPELEPLDLGDYTFTTDPTAGGELSQLFFTTLSRQYSNNGSNNGSNEIQHYHWLFLAPSEDGWWPAFMFSQIDDPKTPRAPTAPRESSDGSVGQGVSLWLRDCRAGAISPLEQQSAPIGQQMTTEQETENSAN